MPTLERTSALLLGIGGLSGIEAIVVLFIWAIPFLAIVFAVRLLLNISGSLTCISGALADIGRSLAKQVPRGD